MTFGSDGTRALFSASMLDMPIPGSDRDRFAQLSVWAQSTQAPTGVGNRIATIERAYDAAVRARRDDAASIARHLGLSTRTLRRQLQSMGTTHREQRDRARRAMAVTMLRTGEASLSEIANRVGFTDSAAFTRAFRRWMGTTPGAFRRAYRAVDFGKQQTA